MKKFVLNISDFTYEKLRFESILQKKSIQEVIQDRVFDRPFDKEVIEAFEDWMENEYNKIVG